MRSRRLAAVAARTTLAVLMTVLMVVLVAGCSDDGPDAADPTDPRASPSSSGTAGEEGSASASTGGPSDPAVEPATGERVTMRSGMSFRLTKGADWGVLGSGTTSVAADAEVEGSAELVLLDAGERPSTTDDLDRAARATLDSIPGGGEEAYPTLRREADREVDGVTGFVLRSENDEARFYLFGAVTNGTAHRISLEVPLELELDDWVEPILASIEWG